jgi:hypothetical protein
MLSSATIAATGSAFRMLKIAIYPEDWAGDVSGDDDDFGERS